MKPVETTMHSAHLRPPAANAPSSRLLIFGIFAAALTVAFALPLWRLVSFSARAEYYSHVLLIPFISGYLISQQRNAFKTGFQSSLLPAVLFGVLGVTALVLAAVLGTPAYPADRHAITMFSYLALLLSGGFAILGSAFLRQFTFAIAFLVFAIPLPRELLLQIQIALQHASAEAAYWIMSIVGIPMIRNGVDFRLPGIPIRVAEECSGFNSSFVLFIVSLLAGHLFFTKPSRKIALALAVIPLAILRNGLRVTVISWLCVNVGPEMIDSWVHRRGGPFFFALSMIPFVGLTWFLRRSENKKPRADQ